MSTLALKENASGSWSEMSLDSTDEEGEEDSSGSFQPRIKRGCRTTRTISVRNGHDSSSVSPAQIRPGRRRAKTLYATTNPMATRIQITPGGNGEPCRKLLVTRSSENGSKNGSLSSSTILCDSKKISFSAPPVDETQEFSVVDVPQIITSPPTKVVRDAQTHAEAELGRAPTAKASDLSISPHKPGVVQSTPLGSDTSLASSPTATLQPALYNLSLPSLIFHRPRNGAKSSSILREEQRISRPPEQVSPDSTSTSVFLVDDFCVSSPDVPTTTHSQSPYGSSDADTSPDPSELISSDVQGRDSGVVAAQPKQRRLRFGPSPVEGLLLRYKSTRLSAIIKRRASDYQRQNKVLSNEPTKGELSGSRTPGSLTPSSDRAVLAPEEVLLEQELCTAERVIRRVLGDRENGSSTTRKDTGSLHGDSDSSPKTKRALATASSPERRAQKHVERRLVNAVPIQANYGGPEKSPAEEEKFSNSPEIRACSVTSSNSETNLHSVSDIHEQCTKSDVFKHHSSQQNSSALLSPGQTAQVVEMGNEPECEDPASKTKSKRRRRSVMQLLFKRSAGCSDVLGNKDNCSYIPKPSQSSWSPESTVGDSFFGSSPTSTPVTMSSLATEPPYADSSPLDSSAHTENAFKRSIPECIEESDGTLRIAETNLLELPSPSSPNAFRTCDKVEHIDAADTFAVSEQHVDGPNVAVDAQCVRRLATADESLDSLDIRNDTPVSRMRHHNSNLPGLRMTENVSTSSVRVTELRSTFLETPEFRDIDDPGQTACEPPLDHISASKLSSRRAISRKPVRTVEKPTGTDSHGRRGSAPAFQGLSPLASASPHRNHHSGGFLMLGLHHLFGRGKKDHHVDDKSCTVDGPSKEKSEMRRFPQFPQTWLRDEGITEQATVAEDSLQGGRDVAVRVDGGRRSFKKHAVTTVTEPEGVLSKSWRQDGDDRALPDSEDALPVGKASFLAEEFYPSTVSEGDFSAASVLQLKNNAHVSLSRGSREQEPYFHLTTLKSLKAKPYMDDEDEDVTPRYVPLGPSTSMETTQTVPSNWCRKSEASHGHSGTRSAAGSFEDIDMTLCSYDAAISSNGDVGITPQVLRQPDQREINEPFSGLKTINQQLHRTAAASIEQDTSSLHQDGQTYKFTTMSTLPAQTTVVPFI